MDKQQVSVEDLGRIEYKTAWNYQEKLLQANVALKSAARKNDDGYDPKTIQTKHHFLFCEHPPVYTIGKSGAMSNLIFSEAEMQEKGISFYPTNRGGDITFHGPGQIVGYPVLDLEKLKTDIGWYLRNLEEVIIETIADYGIQTGRSKGETGVWLDADVPGKERKICAIGVRCSRWVSMHGFAFNVNTDLSYFKGIIPCGIENKTVTSLQQELGREINMEEVKGKIIQKFETIFDLTTAKQLSSF